MSERYTINHFSIGLPKGANQGDVPAFLRHVANAIESMDEPIEVQDMVFAVEIDDDGASWPHCTVYYYPKTEEPG